MIILNKIITSKTTLFIWEKSIKRSYYSNTFILSVYLNTIMYHIKNNH